MCRLAGFAPALPGYYMCCTRGIVINVDVNKDLIRENNLFIYNKALKFIFLLKNLKFLR